MKRFLSLLLALLLLLSACGSPTTVRQFGASTPPQAATAPAPTQPQAPSTITPLLYKITDDAGNTAWLFSSIHAGLPSFYPLPEYVTAAYEGADALAVECDILTFEQDLSAQISALTGLVYADGSTIDDHIPQELYTEAVAVLKEGGLYAASLDVYLPILWSSFIDSLLLETIGADSELGIDLHLLQDAHRTGKEILEVESVQFQYDMLAGFSEELQILLLGGSIYSYRNSDETATQLQALMDAWSTGDEDRMISLLMEEGEFESEQEALLYKEYNDAMTVTRNLAMTDYVEDALASGKEVFICVGVAHVVGSGAMAELLTQRGYTVEPVRP